jgi:hypothetical protein
MDPTREGQTKRGTQRTSVKVDQGQKTGGRSDLTDVLAGPNAIAHRPYGPAPKQGTQGGGRPIDPAVLRKGWVDERAVSTPAVQDATIRPDGTPKIIVEGGSSRVDQPGRG